MGKKNGESWGKKRGVRKNEGPSKNTKKKMPELEKFMETKSRVKGGKARL